MKRREFIMLLGGTAVGWPLVARAQHAMQMRRVGALISFGADDPQSAIATSAFEHGLEKRGWTPGNNVQIEYRWAIYGPQLSRFARELVALTPDVILAVGAPSAAALQKVTRTIPIVFTNTSDPVNGLIVSMERPGGNFTGLIEFAPSIGPKWLKLLKQIAPNVTRVAVIQDPSRSAWRNVLTAIEKAAPSFNVEVNPVDGRDYVKMERIVAAFASSPNGGLIVTPSAFSVLMRDRIIALADRHKLPAIYFSQYFVTDGGLASYAPDMIDQLHRAAGYVGRILKGEKPADMSVHAPSKYDFVINLKAAKAIDLTLSPSLLAQADKVIK